MAEKWVYNFGDGESEGSAKMRNLLGGKGANLAEMCSIGVAVPPGFTITTEVCTHYYDNKQQFPAELVEQVATAISKLEQKLNKKFGDPANPLLVSVRSGARVSMPGMMDTVLNLGMNDEVVQGLATSSGNERFAYDSYRRFIQMYGDVVLGVDHYNFEQILEFQKENKGVHEDLELDVADLKEIVQEFKAKVKEVTGNDFPEDPATQLWGAIEAVFSSWMIPRAISYRKMNYIPEEWGTAVNVQAMVFGNMGEDCATGVAFTRNPSNGDNHFYGEYLINAQGEDVVAGIRTPQTITIMAKEEQGSNLPAMEETMPLIFAELVETYHKLEKHYRDMQDIEFTIEHNKLWILQTRSGKRTAKASIKIAADMVDEGLITKKEALLRVDPLSIDQLLHPTLDPQAETKVIAKALPASPGAAVGKIVFTPEEAESMAAKKEKVILVRNETSPEDISGMHVAQGILTARGGMTSHAAVVARGMGKPCVSGASDIKIDAKARTMTVAGHILKAGDYITINGGTGEVMLGQVPTIKPDLSGDFADIMSWSDEVRTLNVRANAETPHDAQTARDFGAEGIGLCRTEHMFFEGDRITTVREMILSETLEGREKALAKLLPMQRDDFVKIFKIMDGLPITVRLLDPPLHEFLPHNDADIKQVAKEAGIPSEIVKARISALHEENPMLGHRGCRLGITYPEIYAMQARALFEAASIIKAESGKGVLLEVMIPLILSKKELSILKTLVVNVATQVEKEKDCKVEYMIGTMIELPRAALLAHEVAEEAEFFSFGTNDLTQTTCGMSRDDAGSFIGEYVSKGVFAADPFVKLDIEGVGELITLAVERGRKTRPDIKLGICGEHGGEPSSIEFCHNAGLNYVSCSPYRVPIAKLAAAQSALRAKK
jgi:pyruvate,orthophosphate dikinase